MKTEPELIASMSRNIFALKAKNKEFKDDNEDQRMLIEEFTSLMKHWSHSIPDELWNQMVRIINEYERRFTFISEKDRASHPIFQEREIEED